MNKLLKYPPTSTPSLVQNMIPACGVGLLSAPPKIGKSFMVADLCFAVTNGAPFLGRKTTAGSVLYLDFEGSENRSRNRANKMGLSTDSDEILLINKYDTIAVLDGKKKPITLADGTLVEFIEACKDSRSNLSLVVVDTFGKTRGIVKSGGGNAYENDVNLFHQLNDLARKLKIFILFVHHDKKGAGNTNNIIEKPSGSFGIAGSCDVIMNISPRDKHNNSILTIESKDFEFQTLHIVFGKDCRWRLVEKNPGEITETPEDNPIVRFFISKISTLKTKTFFSYLDIATAASVTYKKDEAGNVVLPILKKYQDYLFSEYKIILELGRRYCHVKGVYAQICPTSDTEDEDTILTLADNP